MTNAEFKEWLRQSIETCEALIGNREADTLRICAGLVNTAKELAYGLNLKIADQLPFRRIKSPVDAALRLREALHFQEATQPDAKGAAVGRHVMLTVKQAAGALQISTDTIYNLAREGVLPHKRVGRQFRFHPTDLEEYQREAPKLRVLR
jgi:excisionase family DNA binding protein